MSADPVTTPDPDREQGFRALAFLAVVVLLLVLGTYFFGLGALLMIAIVGSFVVLGVLIYLSAPIHRV